MLGPSGLAAVLEIVAVQEYGLRGGHIDRRWHLRPMTDEQQQVALTSGRRRWHEASYPATVALGNFADE